MTDGALPLRCSLLALLLLWAFPLRVAAQESWERVGAIKQTSMFMDTARIVRSGALRKVWLKSVDPEPRDYVVGRDTLSWDTVVGLNVFDCAHRTWYVERARYYSDGELVLSTSRRGEPPKPPKPGTFLHAVFDDMCRTKEPRATPPR